MDKGLTVPKIGADGSAENTPKFICQSPKVWDFNEKRLHWASVVRGFAGLYNLKRYQISFKLILH